MQKRILLFVLCFLTINQYAQKSNLNFFSISEQIENATIQSIAQDEIGYLWIATKQGVFKFDGNNVTKISEESSNCIRKHQNKIYVGHKYGLTTINKHKKTQLHHKNILNISIIKSGVFLATEKGIGILQKNHIQKLTYNSIIDSARIYDIKAIDKLFYILTDKGLWTVDNLQFPKRIHKISSINFHQLLCIKNEVLLISKVDGVYKASKNLILHKVYDIKNSNSITAYNNELWITTAESGIEIININSYGFIRKINKYNTRFSNKLTSLFVDQQNLLWIGSKNGNLYKYDNRKNIHIEPKVHIEEISVNYTPINHLKNKKLELSAKNNNIAFTFKTIDFKNTNNIKYRYQLNGKYSPWSTQDKVEFAHLKSGDYRFEIQSKSGTNLSKKVSYFFTIANPFYRQVWFYILLCSIFCLLLALGIDLRLRKIKKLNHQKILKLQTKNHLMNLEQKALQLQMNPHFIFNVLNGIKALGNKGNTEELNTTISQFSILLRSVLNNSRLEEITLQNEIETLQNYLALEKQMSAVNFNFFIHQKTQQIDTEEILIPPMLIQPFVENTIKHAFHNKIEKPAITIVFEIRYQFLAISISDNGIGFSESQKKKKKNHKSVAIKVTKERIQNLSEHHNFKILDIIKENKVKGTKISFQIPLKTDY